MRLSCDCQNICDCHAIVKTFMCIIDLLWTYALDKKTERLLYNNVVCSTNSIRLKAFFYKSTFARQIFYTVVPKKWFRLSLSLFSLIQPPLPQLFFFPFLLFFPPFYGETKKRGKNNHHHQLQGGRRFLEIFVKLRELIRDVLQFAFFLVPVYSTCIRYYL